MTSATSATRPKLDDRLVYALADLAAARRQVDAHQTRLAATAADDLVAELITVAPDRSDWDLEDELCIRIGAHLREWTDGPSQDRASPNQMAEAMIDAATTAVRAALRQLHTEPDGWRAAWRVLTAVAAILPYPLSETATDTADDLYVADGGQVLPEADDGPTLTGQILWTRDAYGSRFGVTAAFSKLATGPDRWYLWDIDACGHEPVTVHSAYYTAPEQALAAWQAGVGDVAAAETAFIPVDDHRLLWEIMPAEGGFLRTGGENDEQFAEHYRSRRLTQEVIAAIDAVEQSQPERRADLDAAAAVTEFAAWLQTHRAGQPQPADLEELLTELHLRNYYLDDFADQLIALLPDWVCWLTERNGTAPHLAERCRPYALGEPHAVVGTDDSRPNTLARVTE